ncbi:hypothetical protein C0993_007475, partial [Termitomyces sp. T159_Od127]
VITPGSPSPSRTSPPTYVAHEVTQDLQSLHQFLWNKIDITNRAYAKHANCHDPLPTPRTQPWPQDSNPLKTTPTTAPGPDCYPANFLGSPRPSPPITARQRHQPPPPAASLVITTRHHLSLPQPPPLAASPGHHRRCYVPLTTGAQSTGRVPYVVITMYTDAEHWGGMRHRRLKRGREWYVGEC